MTMALKRRPTLDWQSDAVCRDMNPELFFPEYEHMLDPSVVAACGPMCA